MPRRSVWAPSLLGILVFGVWVLSTSSGLLAPYLLPSPFEVVERLGDGLTRGFLASSLAQTLTEAVLGCLVAAAVGIPVGFAIVHSRTFSLSVEPYIAASQAIPAIAVAPLLVTWVGYGTTAVVVLCAVMIVFPVIVSTAVGVRSIDPDVISAAHLDGASGRQYFMEIEVPLASPNILAGLRTGFTLAITGAVVGEMVIGGQRGLGIELVAAQHLNDIPGLFAAITLLAVVAVSIYLILRLIEDRVVRATGL